MINSTMNAIWFWNIGSDPNSVASRCMAGKIDIIIPYLGAWNTNGTINYNNGYTQGEWKTWVSTLKSKNANFRVLGCVGGSGNASINIGSASIRAAMVSSMVSCVNTLGLDGFNEDTESFTGTKQNLIDLWNAMDDALRPLGKISSADVQVWSAYPANSIAPYVHLTYLMPMCYNGGGWTGSDLQNCISSILTNSISDVIVGLGQYSGASLSSQFASIDAKISTWNTSKLKGFCIFEYSTMTNSDWTTWDNWPTKNPNVTNPILTSITVSPASTSVNMNDTAQLAATCRDQNNNTMTCPTLTWTSSNTSKATVDSTGKVTGIAAGTTNVTTKSGSITSNISTVTVSTAPSGITVTSPTLGLVYGVGESRVVRWTHTSVTGANVKIELLKTGVVVQVMSSSTPNDDAFAWTVPSVATGNDYQVRVTSTTIAQYTGMSSTFTIKGTAPIPVLTSIEVAPTTASINISASVSLGATCKDQNGATMIYPILTWISNDPSKATVDSTGKVTGIAAGTTNVTTKSGSIMSNPSAITVTQSAVNKFSVYDVTPDSVISNVGVIAVLDPVGTFTKDQACVEVCNRLGQI